MNIQTTNRLTAAESALIEAYNAQLGDLPGDGDVLVARDRLLDELKKAGLPTRRIESWHYTDLRNLLRAVPAAQAAPTLDLLAPIVAGSDVLPVLQGVASAARAPDGVTLRRFAESLLDGSAAASLTATGEDDAIGRINVGLGFEAGLSVVMIAMILDRLTSALGRPRAPRRARTTPRPGGHDARPSRGESAADTERSADSTRMERTSA